MARTKVKTDIAKNTADAGSSLSSTVESASQSVAAGIDDLVIRGRRARRKAKAEADRRRKDAERAARKRVTKARKRAQKKVDKAQHRITTVRDDIAADAQYRADGLARAKQGHPKRGGATKKLIKLVATVGAIGAVASRAAGGRKSPPGA